MRTRFKALLVLPILALAIWAWLGLRRPADPATQPAEVTHAPTSTAVQPAASTAALPAGEELECIPPAGRRVRRSSPEEREQDEAAEATERATLRGRLHATGNPEYLAAAALLARESVSDRTGLITQALATGGNNPLILWTAVPMCSGAAGKELCPVDELSDRLIALEPQNSETWMLAAVRRLRRGDEAGALDAVQRAGAAAESRIYWAETIALMERAYAASTDYPFGKRVEAAIGVAGATPTMHGDYSRMCATKSRESPAWAQACLAYGERAEQRGDTVLGESIARGMQITALKQLNDPARLAAVSARQEQSQAELLEAGKESPLVISTPALLAGYLDVLARQGETAALRWSRIEAAQLRANLPPCAPQPPARESASPP